MKQRPPSVVWGSIPKLLFESVLIVFSILLALAVSECSERSNREERAEVALQNIHLEIGTNAAALRSAIPYHTGMLQRLDLLLADSAATLRSRGVFGTLNVIAPEGLQPPSLSTTAWDMAILTDAVSRTDYAKVCELSRLYQLQRMGVESTVPRLGELIFSRETFRAGTDPLPTLSLLQLILNELVTQERYLLERYTAELAGE
jgi:hypothetical protein